MSDLVVEFRIKNGRLKRAILATGARSYREFCTRNGLSYSAINRLLGMRRPAWSKAAGDWSQLAYNVSAAVHLEPEDLWPSEMRDATLSKSSGEFALSLDEAAKMTTPTIDRKALDTLAKALRPNELKVLTAWAKGETLSEAGKGVGQEGGDVTPERARQIAYKGIRRMKCVADWRGITLATVLKGD